MNLIHNAISWTKDRLLERTSYDGFVIIVLSIAAILAAPYVKYAAIIGILYGIWTLWKSE
jgi:hypothetical protein